MSPIIINVIIITKSKIWIIKHYWWLCHETMIRCACLALFLHLCYKWIPAIFKAHKSFTAKSHILTRCAVIMIYDSTIIWYLLTVSKCAAIPGLKKTNILGSHDLGFYSIYRFEINVSTYFGQNWPELSKMTSIQQKLIWRSSLCSL